MSAFKNAELKKWGLALVAGFLFAMPTVADDDDFEEEDSDVYEDDSSCLAPFGTTYYGYALNAAGDTVATVRVREARASRRATSRITIFVTDLVTRSVVTYVAKNCAIPTSGVALTTDGSRFVRFAIDWSGFIGTGDDGLTLKASSNGANKSKTVSIDALTVLKGYHTLALQAREPDQAGTTNGFLAVALNVKAKGRYSATVMMPHGWRFVQSGKLTASGDLYKVGILKSRKYLGGTEFVAFDILLDPVGANSMVTNILKWTSTSPKCCFSRTLEPMDIGMPILTSALMRQLNLIVGCDTATITSLRLASKTGVVNGVYTYPSVNARGKVSKKRGTIRGVDVNGTVYGAGFVLKKTDFPILCRE